MEKDKLYKTVGKYDDQQKYKAITESDMASTTEGLTYNIPINAGNSLSQFWAILDLTPPPDVCIIGNS